MAGQGLSDAELAISASVFLLSHTEDGYLLDDVGETSPPGRQMAKGPVGKEGEDKSQNERQKWKRLSSRVGCRSHLKPSKALR